jgi:hypothetical protein
MRALYADEPASVPDMQSVRGYYASIEAAFTKECSEDLNPYYAQALVGYLAGNVLRGGAQPGRAKEGEDDARTFLSKYRCQSPEAVRLRANLRKLVFARKNARVEVENDARMIEMINPAHRAKLGIKRRPVVETPAEVIFANCRTWLVEGTPPGPGVDREEQRAYCACLAPQLVAAPLDPAERDGLLKNFGPTYTKLKETKQAVMARVMDPCTR